jgi:hypothetical protein
LPASGRPLLLAAVLTALILGARLRPASPLLDAVTRLPPAGVRLELPAAHLVMTPFAALGDVAACSSLPQALSLLFFLLMLAGPARWAAGQPLRRWFSWGGSAVLLTAHAALCALALAWAVLWPRAPSRLAVDDPDLMTVDFHSHTSYSWDGRSWFTPAANLRWHAKTGFDAAFVTDHNRVDGAREARRYSVTARAAGRDGVAAGLEGEELSLHGAHVLLLGGGRFAEPADFAGLDGLRRFLGRSRSSLGGPAVMSLPEYYRHHRTRLETLADWGAAGFEIVASSPRGLDVPDRFRRGVVDLCRARGLFVTGGTDNHGYGSTACVWNLVRVPGWRALDPAAREQGVRVVLARDGFSAVRVVARAHSLGTPESTWELALSGPRALWNAARAWTAAQAFAALAWVWAVALSCGALLNKVT